MLLPSTPHHLLKSTFLFAKDPVDFVEWHKNKLGDNFRFSILGRSVNVIGTPEGAKHILQTNNKNYTKDDAYQTLKLIVGNGLITNEGESWFNQRRLAQPAFYKEKLQEIYRIMTLVTADFMLEMEQLKGSGQSIDVHPLMSKVTLDIVLRSLFTRPLKEDPKYIHESVEFLQDYVVGLIRRPHTKLTGHLTGSHRRYQKTMDWFWGMIKEFIAEREKSTEQHYDLLSMFMDARDEDSGGKMNPQQLLDECMTMIGAGHETSSNALSWGIYLLSQHPEVMQKVKAEAESVYAEGSLPDWQQVHQLQYTKQVVEEIMRLYPPAWAMSRKSIGTDTIDGITFEGQQTFVIPIVSVHRDARYWPSPEKFDPDRFAPELAKERDKFHYFPFGAGPRMCIGNHFAMMEMQLLVAELCRRFRFELASDNVVQHQALITLRPQYGVRVLVN